MRRVAVVTGTRAEYGLLYWLLVALKKDPAIRLQVVACAAHLSPEFGLTYRTIESDGFPIDAKVEMLLSGDTPVSIAKSVGLGCIGFADAFAALKPDVIVVLGDRYEIIAAATAALVARIPLAHIHGGERTEGAIDDSIRHSVTKMAHLHFTTAEEYRQRVIQLGEDPSRVFNFGPPGLDHLRNLRLLSREELGASIGFALDRPFFAVTYHPATLSDSDPLAVTQELLAALDAFADHKVVVTAPNADTSGRAVLATLREHAERNSARAHFALTLNQTRYLSLVSHAAAVVGNSSSGILEAPALGTPTVNLGDRQRGRLRAASVIDCAENKAAIQAAIARAVTPAFRDAARKGAKPRGDWNASARIAAVLATADLSGITRKSFRDLPGPA